MITSSPRPAAWLSAVHDSHQRLVDVVTPLTPQQLTGPSYASEWSIAQVLSHLGSGAEIFVLLLDAGRRGQPAPGAEAFQPIWGAWDAKVPADQAGDALRADRKLLEQLDALDAQQRSDWRLSLFGAERDFSDLLRMRLGEHAVHTWDVAVAGDSSATIAQSAVDLLIDSLPDLAGRAGRSAPGPLLVRIRTDRPERHFVLRSGDEGTQIEGIEQAGGPDTEPTLVLPAEALIRLVYGRLDEGHTPPLTSQGVDLDALRAIFPGF